MSTHHHALVGRNLKKGRTFVGALLTAILGLAFLVAPPQGAFGSAPTVDISLSAPQVVTSAVNDASVKTETFNGDEFPIGDLPESGTFAVGTFTTSVGGASIGNPAIGTDWGGTGTKYLIVKSGSSLTITLSNPSKYVGFFWGGGDPNNTVELWGGAPGSETRLGEFSSSFIDGIKEVEDGDYFKKCVQAVIDANKCGGANYAYVNMQLSDPDAAFTKLIFRQGGSGGFEVDNLTTSEVRGGVVKKDQTISWSPVTSVSLADSGLTLAATVSIGDGALSYEVVNAGTTGCSVDGNVLSFTSTGSGADGCEVRPLASSTPAYNAKTDAATVTFTITPMITKPTAQVDVSSSSFTSVCEATCQLVGFDAADQILVIIGKSGGVPLEGRVRLTSAVGVTQGETGYQTDATAPGGHPEIAIVGTPAQINAVLNTLQYKAPAGGGDETLSISASLAGAAFFAGTGHYYEFVSATVAWATAKSNAASKTFNGLTGYLATVTSLAENQFITSKVGTNTAWLAGTDSEVEGTWKWDAGPEAGTTFWTGLGSPGFDHNTSNPFTYWGSGEPNQSGNEDCLEIISGGSGRWNDIPCDSSKGYVVEYGGLAGESIDRSAFATFDVSAPVPTAPQQVSGLTITPGNGQLVLSWTAPNSGGPDITDYIIEQFDPSTNTWTALTDGVSASTTFTVTGLTNGTSYQFRVAAVNDIGTGTASVTATGTPVAPPPPPAPTPTPTVRPPAPAVDPTLTTPIAPTGGQVVLPPSRTPAPGTAPAPLAGPLPDVSGNGGQVPQAPTALIGGRLAPVNTNVVNQNQVNLQTGGSSFGVSIPQGQGSVAAQGGNTELAVQFGAQTRLSGAGLFPGSTVQVFMPLGPNGSREIAQLPVGPSGTFDGDAAFTTRPTDPPLPVGRNVLQIASLNEAGERVIVEMAINIAQSAPAPEILRTNGEIPGLTPGQSLATRAGEPVDVRLTVDSTSRLTTVEGDGWTFSINVAGGGNSVEETADGGALISVLRGGEASISGNGFMPLTRADIWLFSDPTLLGSVDIDENGEFNGTVIVDGRVVPVGDHTLQIQGVGVDGFVLSANLGVVVSDPDQESTATTEQAAAGVLWWVVALIALLVVAVVVWSVVRRRRGQAY